MGGERKRAMVFACSDRSKRTPKAAPPPNLSPTFKWGGARRMRCELPAANGSNNGAKPAASLPETEKKEEATADREAARAATAACHKKGASVMTPPLLEEGGGEEKRKRKKEKMAEFRLTLSRDEIDEDFYAITGARTPRRPKRRPKVLQSKIESLFLCSLFHKTIAPHRYMVPD